MFKNTKSGIKILSLKELHIDFLNLNKKSKVIKISKKYLDSKYITALQDYFDQLLFETKRINRWKEYKKNFSHCVKYQTTLQKLSDKVENWELEPYILELVDLYWETKKVEFLLDLYSFSILYLENRKIILYKNI